VLSLELAVLVFQQERWTEAADLASEALLFLSEFQIPDVITALKVLKSALEARTLTINILEQVRVEVRRQCSAQLCGLI
jgi:hypothetical protein